MKILYKMLQEIGLKINIHRTEIMFWNRNKSSYGTHPESIVMFMDQELVDNKSYTYFSA